MMKSAFLKAGAAIAFGIVMMAAQPAFSATPPANGVHKIVFQVSDADETTQHLTLNNAVNIQKHYGPENVEVVIVAYGPGLSILTKKSKEAERVKSLAIQGITFDACNNTMKAIEKKTGKMPVLTDGVKIVPAGVARIVELQEQGYAYIKP
jgi:intracellular sulfur oxidation DsrE/DsrF family protein